MALATFQLALMPKSGREVSEVTARVGGASWAWPDSNGAVILEFSDARYQRRAC